MNLTAITLVCAACLICLFPPVSDAQQNAEESPNAATQPATAPAAGRAASRRPDLAVALLDFATSAPGAEELGAQIGEVLTATLSSEPGFRLVDRATLTRTLEEHELNLSGVVDTDQAVKVGKLVGARILVTGKVFQMGKKVFITAKLIGTETSLVEGVLVKGEGETDLAEMLMEAAMEIGERLRTAGPRLVSDDDVADPLPGLKEKLGGLRRPVVAVVITETHMGQQVVAPAGGGGRVPDPAVETEVKKLLRECGFEIVDVEQNVLADWARRGANRLDGNNWPKGLQNADMVITGEAFSEFAARIGNLVSCLARAEINVISRKEGKIVLADRETTRAVDLAENIAGKKALEKAGHVIGLRVLEYFAETQPAAANEVR